ncbi:hypothetical protein ACET3Z_005284 [Daucus carota]
MRKSEISSWVKEPLKKKQVAVEKKTFKAEQIPHDHASGSKGLGDCIQDKIVAAGDEEIISRYILHPDRHCSILLACIGDDGAEKTPETAFFNKITRQCLAFGCVTYEVVLCF